MRSLSEETIDMCDEDCSIDVHDYCRTIFASEEQQ
jgi:hypothetical protein